VLNASIKVSLVIPIRNEEDSLEALISSIANQTYPPAETILVDGGSTDKTIDLAHKLIELNPNLRLIQAGNATPGKGRNVGIAAATNDWIALTDAGIQLEPTWLERLVDVVCSNPSIDVVYGNYEPAVNSYFEKLAALSYPAPKQKREGGRMRGPFIASSLLRRHVWKSVGGFPDLRAAEDLIFMRSIEEAGFNIGWAPKATVWWHLQPSMRHTFNKFALYSKHNVWAGQQRYWHYGLVRQYAIVCLSIFLALIHSSWWLLILPLWLIARTAKSIWLRLEEKSIWKLLDPVQFIGVSIVLLSIDLATFVGWFQALHNGLANQNKLRNMEP
jgi:glycosyltransferase involved in cell wall biosynthesis